jgi:uncharacterized protein
VTTYLLVDGENIDATLGNNVLGGRRPAPDERPRWDRVLEWARGSAAEDEATKGLFFLNASSGNLPTTFVAALLAIGFQPLPLSSHEAGVKVVDVGIQRTLEALVDRPGDVLLASHDGDFLSQVEGLLDGTRKVGIIGFREFFSGRYQPLVEKGLTLHDLEDDVRAFNGVLPRTRIIDLADFDPTRYL